MASTTSGSGSTRVRRQLPAEERRASILATANELVAERGLAELSIAAVAARAGISRSVVYHHFEDVNALLLELVKSRLSWMRANLDSSIAARPHEGLAVITEHLHEVLTLPADSQRLIRSILGDRQLLPLEIWPTVSFLRRNIVQRWAAVLAPEEADPALSQARTLVLFHAIVGAWELLSDHTVTEDQAMAILRPVTRSLFPSE